jgi:hypothetical protein
MKLRTRGSASPEGLAAARNQIQSSLGVKIDSARLDRDEQVELLELAHQCRAGAEPGVDRFNPQQLTRKELSKFEALVEKAAAMPGLFKRHREEAAQQVKLVELARRALKAPPQPRFEAEGAVVLPPELFEDLEEGVVWAEDVAVFAYVMSQFATGGTMLPPRARMEPDGVIVFDQGYGYLPMALDPDGRLRCKASLDNLVRAGWLSMNGQRVSRGPRLLEALKARAAS